MRAALLLLVACSEPASLDDETAESVAMSIASTLCPPTGGGELGAMLGAAQLVRGDSPPSFVDGHGSYTVACRDDHNRAITCGAHTDNADVAVAWAGVLVTDRIYVVASREAAWMLNDVTTDRIRVDGDSHFEYANRLERADGTAAAHDLTYDASFQNVVLHRGAHWPRGGLVRYELAVARSGAGPREDLAVSVDARFDASGIATIVLPDHAYTLDLASGALRVAE